MKLLFAIAALTCFSLTPLPAQWEFNFDQEGGAVYSIERAPNGTLWAATGNGLYSSADDGLNWTLSPLIPASFFIRIAQRSGNNMFILASKSYSWFTLVGVLVYSTDGGITWKNQPFQLPETPFNNFRTLDDLFLAGNSLFLDAGDFIYQSDDFGQNWVNICQPDWNVNFFSIDGNLMIHAEETQLNKIRVSSDKGVTWTEPALPAYQGQIQATFVYNNTLFIADGAGRILISANQGASWTIRTLPGVTWSNNAHFRRDNSTNTLFVSAGPRLFSSPDNGATWTEAAPTAPAPVLDFVTAGNRIYGAGEAGMIYYNKGANAWEIRKQGIRARAPDLLKTFDDVVYTAFGNRAFRSTDGGDNWEELQVPVLQNATTGKVIDLAKDGDNLFMLTNTGVIQSTDNGDTWPGQYTIPLSAGGLSVNPDQTLWLESDGFVAAYSLFDLTQQVYSFDATFSYNPYDVGTAYVQLDYSVFPGWPNRILAIGESSGKVYYSDNQGQSWAVLNTADLSGQRARFYKLPDALILISDYKFLVSYNNGQTWEAVANGALAPDWTPADFTATLSGSANWYACNWKGVFRRPYFGGDWELLNDGLPALSCQNISYAQGYVFTALQDKGIWRRDAAAPLSPVQPETISGPDQLCAGAQGVYCIPDQPGTLYYAWQAPAGASINGGGNKAILPAPAGNCVTITFADPSGIVKVGYHHEQSNAMLTASAAIKNLVPTKILLPLKIPYESLPAVWPVNGQLYPNDFGTYVLEAVFTAANGCDSVVKQTLTIQPPVATTATGFVYWDDNNNGVFDAGELKFTAGATIKSSSGPATVSGADGVFLLAGLSAGAILSVTPPLSNTVLNPPSRAFTDLAGGPYHFGIYAPAGYRDLSIDLVNVEPFRPGFTTNLSLAYQNVLPTGVANTAVTLVLPAGLAFVSSSMAPVSVSGNVVTWNAGLFKGLSKQVIKITVTTDVALPIGAALELTAAISPVNGDLTPSNNTYTLKTVVVGSFDPNDKQVSPPYVTPEMLAGNQAFEYTIRFQNTGNYPAEMVRITDTLSDRLDWSTFRLVASSHACTWKLRPAGIIEFFFEKINLPDSLSNEPESHGFVKFTIQPKNGLSIGDMVENRADIFFDYNRPVRTNTAGTQVVYFLPNDPPEGNSMSSRPNPASYVIHFSWSPRLKQAGLLRLFTQNGVPVNETPVAEGSSGADMYVADQPQGAYVAVLEAGPQRYVRLVLVQRPAGAVIKK